jgi:hypothetical protein
MVAPEGPTLSLGTVAAQRGYNVSRSPGSRCLKRARIGMRPPPNARRSLEIRSSYDLRSNEALHLSAPLRGAAGERQNVRLTTSIDMASQ